MAHTKLSGLDLVCDLTPRWWPGMSYIERRKFVAKVIEEIAQMTPWVVGVEYDMAHERFRCRVLLSEDVTLQTMMQKREDVIDKLDAVKG